MRPILHRFLPALALAFAMAFLGAGAAGANSALKRLGDRDDLLGWEAVGRLDIGNEGFCTGTLIAPDLVLTAAHCVFDRRSGARYAAKRLTFRAGLRDGEAIASRRVAAIGTHPGYDPKKDPSPEQVRFDAALLKLDRPIPAAQAAPFALHGAAVAGDRVSVVSYGRGRAEALSWQRDCGLLARGNGLMAFDCDVTFGSSGAPVFVREGRRARILSLVSSGGAHDGASRSFGMELPALVARLKRELRKNPGRPQARAGGTAMRRIGVSRPGEPRANIGARFIKR